ncbi:MAG: Rne/Rng family ribonuclease [Phycisphaerales bacterium JB037]
MSKSMMLINYQPGEDCRIAMVEDGKVEEYHAEPTENVSRVNNVYVGRVVNVEPAIQAAFVDFGIGVSGFLHVSDLHPQYFGDEPDAVERVGRKTPRRDRPPIQEALKKGQEIIVQVLKEGVGTKGPTLTSYLSIPGRFLVMMPNMDKVGVSRKVEDEEVRKKMRDILSQLELPDGFGFILRTAGFDRTKTDLKRDLAYLMRLWKDMEDRRGKGKKPRLLYTESDLLVRALRDMVTSEVDEIVIDHPAALRRAARFMKIVSPRAQAKLMRYTGDAPLFHAFGIEEQILAMHAREVPLPSGGRLVIDETEALVAIDVNSGRSRGARDAETNAYQTNLEAADEICRQLRLRDLGGLVINDFIDMRSAKNRKAIEQRVRERLKRDRAKSTILPISNFGILEMTRQRMRASHERAHFAECPTCRGRGLLQRSQSVAADALRELSALLAHDRIHRVEVVVSPRVAGALLSSNRRSLTRIETATSKTIEVRVSDQIPLDRVTMYAYDDAGADINIEKLPGTRGKPSIEAYTAETDPEDWAVDPAAEAAEVRAHEQEAAAEALASIAEELEPSPEESGADEGGTKKKRRRRRRRRKSGSDEASGENADSRESDGDSRGDAAPDDESKPAEGESDARGEGEGESGEGQPRKKRRRRRRRRGKGSGEGVAGEAAEASHDADSAARRNPEGKAEDKAEGGPDIRSEGKPASDEASDHAPAKKPARKKTRSKRMTKAEVEASGERETGSDAPAAAAAEPSEESGATKKKSRRRSSKKTAAKADAKTDAKASASTEAKPAGKGDNGSPAKPKRSLYGASRRKLAPSEIGKGPSRDR